jgi:hypothetical protein
MPSIKPKINLPERISNPHFTGKDVKRVHFIENKLVGNGSSGCGGKIHVGKIHFSNGGVRKVAIKTYNIPLTDKAVAEYKKVISDLNEIKLGFDKRYPGRKEGANLLPKMDFYKLKTEKHPDGEWVMITPLFANSKNKSKFWWHNRIAVNHQAINEYLWITNKVIEKGYQYADLATQLKKTKQIMPLDIDMLVELKKKYPIRNASEKAFTIRQNLQHFILNLVWVDQRFDDLPASKKLNSRLYKKILDLTINSDISPKVKEKLKVYRSEINTKPVEYISRKPVE